MGWTRQRLNLFSRMRFRKSFESTVYITTFIVALFTVSVSASAMLPCPANSDASLTRQMEKGVRNAFTEEQHKEQKNTSNIDRESLPVGGLGQRAHLTKKNGWIEIDERPSLFSWRRWAS